MTKKEILEKLKKPINVPLIESSAKTVTFLTTTISRVN